jgi:hypothetical protein
MLRRVLARQQRAKGRKTKDAKLKRKERQGERQMRNDQRATTHHLINNHRPSCF